MVQIKKITEGSAFKWGKGNTNQVFGPQTGAKHLTLNYATFKPGQAFPQHIHENSEDIIVVLKGRGVIRLGHEELPIEEGDAIYIPAGQVHGTVAAEDSPLVVISSQAPQDKQLYTGEKEVMG